MIICTITATLSMPQILAQPPQRAEDGSDLFRFDKDGHFGFMDVDGNIVIDNRFRAARDFVDGYAVVALERIDPFSAWAVIDINGNVVSELSNVIGIIDYFREGIAVVHNARGFHFIDKKGNDPFADHPMVVEPDGLLGFSEGFAVVRVTGERHRPITIYGRTARYIDRYGNLSEMNFSSASSFSNGFAVVRRDGEWAIINTDFELVIDFDNEYQLPFSEVSPCGHIVAIKENAGRGLINIHTGVFTRFAGEHRIIRPPSDGLVMAIKDGFFGFVDMDNNIVVPFQYRWATDFYQGIAIVMPEQSHFNFIDNFGNLLYSIYVRSGSALEWNRELLFIPHEGFSLNRNFERVYPRWQSPPERIAVVVNNWRILFDVDPIIHDNRTLVPFRGIFEELGMQVEWNEYTRTAIGTRGNLVIEIPIDSNIAYVNGEPVELEVPAMLHNDRTFIPVRFVAEASGADVDWVEESRTVAITTN